MKVFPTGVLFGTLGHVFQRAAGKFLAIVFLFFGASCVQGQEMLSEDLASLSLEQLSTIQVTSVSRTKESLSSSAAAVAVVTADDIRRSGVTTIPEALRMVPGVHVARQNSNTWAVSARGFSSSNSRNLLVQSDTRSIYTPLFSGVFWDAQDYLMEDIERIEVVRGPGASLWGSNAVNGVVSITTKNSKDTQGLYAEALLGNEERGAGIRYGGKTKENIYYRVFLKHSDRDSSYAPAAESEDDWDLTHMGFRTDWDDNDDDRFTFQGDLYEGTIGQLVPAVRVIGRGGPEPPLAAEIRGGNLLGRWRHQISDASDYHLRIYHDYTYRDDPSYKDTLNTTDIDFQHRMELGDKHELLWGMNYRISSNENIGKGIFQVVPEESDDELYSLFVQDQYSPWNNVRITLGTKLEHNDFSGFEIQPTVRAAWEILPGHTVWSAVSRAVRTPTRYERDVAIDAGFGANGEVVRLLGNDDFEPEETLAYEVGYRWHALDSLSLDIAAFHNEYDELSSIELGEPFVEGDDQVVLPLMSENLTDGYSRGFEALVSYTPMNHWRLTTSYAYLDMELFARGMDINFERLIEGSTPRHQFAINSAVDWRDYQFDLQLRYQGEIESIPAIRDGETIPAYTELNMRIARQFGDHIEVSLVGNNLLDGEHPEFGEPDARGQIERSVYGKVVYRY